MPRAPAVGDQLVHRDVHARELGSPARQHALSRDLREERRGRVRPPPLSGLLRRRRLRRDGVADGDDPWLRLGCRRARADARRERRHLGRARGVPRPLSACADQDARARVLREDPGLGLPGRLVPLPAPRSARCALHRVGGGKRRGVLRARRRVRVRLGRRAGAARRRADPPPVRSRTVRADPR